MRSCHVTVDESLMQADESARHEALDVSRSFIVQAPAGSGKTELLIQRYLRLLGTVDDPEEILAITFTRKAAAEMQLRVLDALRREADGIVPEEPHLQITAELAKQALRRSRERGWELLGSPRRMRILTLDALNASIARAQPLTSEHGIAGGRVVVDVDRKSVHREAALATLDWLVETGSLPDAARQVLAHVDNNTGSYIAHVAAMLGTRDQWLPFIGSGSLDDVQATSLRERFEGSLHLAVTGHLERTRDVFEPYEQIAQVFDYAAQNLVADDKTDHPMVSLAGRDCLPGTQAGEVAAWQGLAEMLLVRSGPQFRKKMNKNVGFPAGKTDEKALIESMLEALAGNDHCAALLHAVRTLPPLAYTDEQWRVLLALFRLLPLAVSELKRLFAEQGLSDHIEIALAAGAALGSAESPGDVALLLDYKLSHVLVDEMQDTSSAQYRMLEALTGGWEQGDGRTLFCVGDPMQSIYRFRNAEVGQFLLARENGIGDIKLDSLVLRRNFRSGENLVDWFNAVFPSVLAAKNDPARGEVAYEAAVSAKHLAGMGNVAVHPVFGTDKESEAVVGRNAIRAIVEKSPQDDIAVLVQGRSQLPGLLAQLREAGIGYTAVEIDRLTDLPEVIDLLALTRAAIHPGDRIAWLGILRSPWIGLTWSDLHALANSDRRSTILELLSDADRIGTVSAEGRAAIQSALPHLLRLIAPERVLSLADRVERCWLAMGGPAILLSPDAAANVYRFLDVIRRHERGGLLPDVAELESLLDDERVSSSSTSSVQVMTMHRAKGLQFDHVVLYGLGRQPGGGNPDVLSWFDIPEQRSDAHRVISPIGPRADVERDPVHRYIAVTDAAKDAMEEGRLLYVACTRAQKSLHLVGNVSVSADGDEMREARNDSLLRFLWPAVREQFAVEFQSDHSIDSSDTEDWIQPERRVLDRPWQLPEALPLPSGPPLVEVSEENEVEFYWVGTEARIAGTLVHRWLQLIAEGKSSINSAATERGPVTARWLREMGIGAEAGKPIVQRVNAALDGVLGDAKGRWCVDGPGHAELALSGVDDGAIVTVILDRVRIDENGRHWIVDYKTSSHEGGNLEGFLQVESDRYRPQLERYAKLYAAWSGETPACALYFPLLGRFVEIDVNQ